MKRRWIVVLIVINLLLALLSALWLVGTCLNNKIINEASQIEYRSVNSEDEVRLNVDGGNTVVLHFGADSVRITDSFKITDRDAMLSVVCFVEDYVWESAGYRRARRRNCTASSGCIIFFTGSASSVNTRRSLISII